MSVETFPGSHVSVAAVPTCECWEGGVKFNIALIHPAVSFFFFPSKS